MGERCQGSRGQGVAVLIISLKLGVWSYWSVTDLRLTSHSGLLPNNTNDGCLAGLRVTLMYFTL